MNCETKYLGTKWHIKPDFLLKYNYYDKINPHYQQSIDEDFLQDTAHLESTKFADEFEKWYKINKRQNRFDLSRVNTTNDGINISANASRKIKASIQWIWTAGYKKHYNIKFITLTYSTREKKSITDYEIKQKLMKNFIKRLHYEFGDFAYIWRIEKHRGGNLNTHVHLLWNIYIPKERLRYHWNRILKENGLTEGYFRKYKTHKPSSTEIHALKKIKNVPGYLIKGYFCKGIEEEKEYIKLKKDLTAGNCTSEMLKLYDKHKNNLDELYEKIKEIKRCYGHLWGRSRHFTDKTQLELWCDADDYQMNVETERIIERNCKLIEIEINEFCTLSLYLFTNPEVLPAAIKQRYYERLERIRYKHKRAA